MTQSQYRDKELKAFINSLSALPLHFWKDEDIETLSRAFDRWFYSEGRNRWWNGLLLRFTAKALVLGNEFIG